MYQTSKGYTLSAIHQINYTVIAINTQNFVDIEHMLERKLHHIPFITRVFLTGFKAVNFSDVGTAIAPRIAVLVAIACSIGRIARRPITATGDQKVHAR